MSTTQIERIANHYVVKRQIGVGAMGEVFLAVDDRLDRPVAIKLMKMETDPASREQFVQRFRQEAKTIARLNHPNIVGLFDLGTEGDNFYMVMEYVDGRNLQEILDMRQSLMAVRSVVRIGIQLCEALKYAHANDIVHRDIKPANIMISTKYEVKLTDFGIARINEQQDLRLTQAGMMLGSFLYAAPEQLTNAAAADYRADIYSVGATLYEMLTGKPVYEADHVGRLIQLIFTQEPVSPQEINADVPEALVNILWKALAKHPDQRYQDVAELQRDLVALAGGTVGTQSSLGDTFSLGNTAGGATGQRDTRMSQIRASFLRTTTQSGSDAVQKYLRSDQAWLTVMLEKYPMAERALTFAQVRQQLHQADLQGNLFTGVLSLQDVWVLVKQGEIAGAYYSLEGLVHDDAMRYLQDSSPLLGLYTLPEPLVLSLVSVLANDGQPVQENLDAGLVNLYPVVADLTQDKFSGYVIVQSYPTGQQTEDQLETHVFFFNEGQVEFSFSLNHDRQFTGTGVSLEEVLGKGHALMSIYRPRERMMQTVIKDLLSKAVLKASYIDAYEGKLDDVMQLASGEMSHCLSEAIGQNFTFQVEMQGGVVMPDAMKEKIKERAEYKIAHWLCTEFFFSLNALQQAAAFKQFYPLLPQVHRVEVYPDLASAYGCQITYTLAAYRAGVSSPLWIARLGSGDPSDLELFIDECSLVKEGADELLGAFYLSQGNLGNQAIATFTQKTQKLGLFNKLKGYVSAGKKGYHLFLLDTQGEQPRLVAPNLI